MFLHHNKEIPHSYLELCTNKKERICNQDIKMRLLCIKALSYISLKVCCENAKAITPNLQNV